MRTSHTLSGKLVFFNDLLFVGTGMVIIAIPILTSQQEESSVTGGDAGGGGGEVTVSDRTEYYTTAKNLLTSGADAMERLMTVYKVRNKE